MFKYINIMFIITKPRRKRNIIIYYFELGYVERRERDIFNIYDLKSYGVYRNLTVWVGGGGLVL